MIKEGDQPGTSVAVRPNMDPCTGKTHLLPSSHEPWRTLARWLGVFAILLFSSLALAAGERREHFPAVGWSRAGAPHRDLRPRLDAPRVHEVHRTQTSPETRPALRPTHTEELGATQLGAETHTIVQPTRAMARERERREADLDAAFGISLPGRSTKRGTGMVSGIAVATASLIGVGAIRYAMFSGANPVFPCVVAALVTGIAWMCTWGND